MYIHNTLSRNPINPNIVSGADYDKNYSHYSDSDELERIHKSIQQQLAEVVNYKSILSQLESRLKNLKLVDNWTPLIYQRNNGTLENTHELHMKIVQAKKEKDESRMKYSQLQSEISKTNTEIQRREQGSIYGLKQQFQDISGEDYKGVYNPSKKEYLENDNTVIDNNSINEEIEAELNNGNTVNENLIGIPIPEFSDSKKNLIDKISEMVGVSKQNTKYGLIGLGVVAIVVIVKNK